MKSADASSAPKPRLRLGVQDVDEATFSAALRAMVQESLDDPRPPVPHETAIARMYAAIERGRARNKLQKLSV